MTICPNNTKYNLNQVKCNSVDPRESNDGKHLFFNSVPVAIDDINVLNVPEILVIIESVPDDESIQNLESYIIQHELVAQLCPLPQETGHPNGLRLSLLLQQAQQPPNGPVHVIIKEID